MSDALFELPADYEPPQPETGSADTRRTKRQLGWLSRGIHPITHLVLHVDAAPFDDRKAEGLRCDTCVHHVTSARRGRSFNKCDSRNGAYTTRSSATDCRAWWPACLLYEPKETQE